MGIIQLLVLESQTLLLTDIAAPIPALWLACLLVGSEDPDEGVASVANTLRKQCPTPNMEDVSVIEQLQVMFLGDPTSQLEPMGESIRLRILRLLNRSILAGKRLSDGFRIVQACLAELSKAGLRTRIPEEGLQFSRWIIQEARKEEMDRNADRFYHILLPLLTGLSTSETGSVSGGKQYSDPILLQAYATLGALCHRCPEYFQSSLSDLGLPHSSLNSSLIISLFRSCEDPGVSSSVRSGIRDVLSTLLQDALVPWVEKQLALKSLEGREVLERLFPLLHTWSHSSVPIIRYCAVRYVAALYTYESNLPATLLCLESMTDDQGGIREVAKEGLYGAEKGGQRVHVRHVNPEDSLGLRLRQLVKSVVHQSNNQYSTPYTPETLREMIKYAYYLFLTLASQALRDSSEKSRELEYSGKEGREVQGPALHDFRQWAKDQEEKYVGAGDDYMLLSILQLISTGMEVSLKDSIQGGRGTVSLVDTCILLASHLTKLGIYLPYWTAFSRHWTLLRDIALGTGLWSLRCKAARIMAYIILAGQEKGDAVMTRGWLDELKMISSDQKGKKEEHEGSRFILAASLGRAAQLNLALPDEVIKGTEDLVRASEEVLRKAEERGGESVDQAGLPTLLSLEELVKYVPLSSLNPVLMKEEGLLGILLHAVGEGKRVGPRIRDTALRCLGWINVLEETDRVAKPLLDSTLPKIPSLAGKRSEGLESAGEVLTLVLFSSKSSFFSLSIDLPPRVKEGEAEDRGSLLSISLNLLESMSESDKAWERRAAAVWIRTLLKETDKTTGSLNGSLSLENVRRLHRVACALMGDKERIIQMSSLRALLHAYRSFPDDTSMHSADGMDQGRTVNAKVRILLDDLKISLARPTRSHGGSENEEDDGGAPIQVVKVMLSLAEATGNSLLVYPLLELGLLPSSQTFVGEEKVMIPEELTVHFHQMDTFKEKKEEDPLSRFIPFLYRTKHHPVEKVREASQRIWDALVETKRSSESSPKEQGIWDLQGTKESVMSLLVSTLIDRSWEVRESR